jgi:hypothetical protein
VEKKRKDDLILAVTNDWLVLITGALAKKREQLADEGYTMGADAMNAMHTKFLLASRENGKRVVTLKGDLERNYVCNAIYDAYKQYEHSGKAEDSRLAHQYADIYNTIVHVPTKREYRRAQREALREREVR